MPDSSAFYERTRRFYDAIRRYQLDVRHMNDDDLDWYNYHVDLAQEGRAEQIPERFRIRTESLMPQEATNASTGTVP